MYVVQFAQRMNPRAALVKPAARSVASLNTHDMPTFAAHWRGLDIDDRIILGLFTKAEARKEHIRRAELNLALAKFLQRKGLKGEIRNGAGSIHPAAILKACLQWLQASRAELVLVNLEDLWEEENPQNVPGTSMERPNWRRKARLSVEQILRNVEFRDVLSSLRSSAYTK
jgi:4-alpha-glucanotransferase